VAFFEINCNNYCFIGLFCYICTSNSKTKVMALKDQLTKSDYISLEELARVSRKLRKDKNFKWELYFLFSLSSALRVGDVLSTKWCDVVDKTGNVKPKFIKKEQKTGKTRVISFSNKTSCRIAELYVELGRPNANAYMFAGRSGEPMSRQYINQELKRIKTRYSVIVGNFSTHSFRKSFGRAYWEREDRSSAALVMLMGVFNHTSVDTTRRYLGITDEEIESVYVGLEL